MEDKNVQNRVPVIDFRKSDEEAAEELFNALTTVGFACLTGTDVWKQAKDYSRNAREFFKLPQEVKANYAWKDLSGWSPSGIVRMMKDKPADCREGYHVTASMKDNSQYGPDLITGEHCWQLWDSFSSIAHRVNYLIGLSLKLKDPHYISKTHTLSDGNINRSAIRINWYPEVNRDEAEPGQMRCGEHSDFGSVTLLYTDSPGLQVMNRATGEFFDADHVEGGIYLNIGDLLQMWTADKLVANKHRVLIPEQDDLLEKDRLSVVFFCQPDNDTLTETLDGSGKYPPVTSAGWLEAQLSAIFKDNNSF